MSACEDDAIADQLGREFPWVPDPAGLRLVCGKLDTSTSALLTEDFLALLKTADDRQAEATERTLERLYAVRMSMCRALP